MESWKPILDNFKTLTRGNFVSLNPNDIIRLPECQPRVDGTDAVLSAEYAQDMRDYDEMFADHDPPIQGWKKFPSIGCVHDPQIGYILYSGNHRLDAILQVGYTAVEVHFITGTRQDAIVLSKNENSDNGKRRTNADKAHVVKSCLLDPELKLWSDRTIAKWCGVAPSTVKNSEISLSNLDSDYERPTRRKRLSKTGEIEWVETASIGNGSEKLNRKALKVKHHSAVVNVQSAFFTADLHKQLPFSELGDKKVSEFFKRTVIALRLRLNIFTSQYYHKTGGNPIFAEDCIEAYRGADLTNAEIEAEIEVLEDIASKIRWYGETEDGHLGWIDNMLVVKPEQQETEPESDNLYAVWKNEWLPRLKEVFVEKGCDPKTIHPNIYEAVEEDQKTRIYDMSDSHLTALISQSKTVFNWKDNPEHWVTNRGKTKIGWALRLLEEATAAQETNAAVSEESQADHVKRLEALPGEIKAYIPKWIGANPVRAEKFEGFEGKVTLKLLLNARYQIEFGIERGSSPFFREEMEELLDDMKANDAALIEKVFELLEPTASDEVSNGSESNVISEARSQVSEIIEELDEPKPPTESVADVLNGDTVAFVTVCLRKSSTITDEIGRLEYITFEGEPDRDLGKDNPDISVIPDTLLAQLLKIAKEENQE